MERSPATEPLVRHFTATGFLSHDGRTALHWHRLGKWLPPGGHLEENEDPVQTVLREIEEETGIPARVIETATAYDHGDRGRVAPPVSIGVYAVPRDGRWPASHHHIDFIYFARPVQRRPRPTLPAGDVPWLWVSETELRSEKPLVAAGRRAPIEEDVRLLGLAAIAAERADRERAAAPHRAGAGVA